jgi:hypothetical protein
MYCSLVLNAKIISWVKVIEQITPLVIINAKIIHSELWGPAPVMTTTGFTWFVTFIDDCTRVSWVYVLKYKKDVLPFFSKIYHPYINSVLYGH